MAKDLVKKLIEVDIEKRYTATQALNHPWVLNKGPTEHVRIIKMKFITH